MLGWLQTQNALVNEGDSCHDRRRSALSQLQPRSAATWLSDQRVSVAAHCRSRGRPSPSCGHPRIH